MRLNEGGRITATCSRTSSRISYTRAPLLGSYSRCRRKSNKANSSCRTICMPGLIMPSDQVERLALPAPVLHEQARQLLRVPRHTGDACDALVIHPGQHVMQAMAEFVEQRQHLVVREQRGVTADRR